MDPAGTTILLFGNDVREEARAAYEHWHAGHHVPQRLTVPGLLGAIRFRLSGHGSPEYLTLYRLRDPDVLESPEYGALINQPDAQTLAMRPNLIAPRRFVARVGTVPALPEGFAMRAVESQQPLQAASDGELIVITGQLVADQRNHPIMGAAPLPSGYLQLRLGPVERLESDSLPEGKVIGGLYLPIDRFGREAQQP